jgi:hypothetical protein
MSARGYNVVVDARAGVPLADVARRLTEAGFEVTHQLDAVGIIVGRADPENVERLRAVPGVGAIEEERTVRPRSSERRS